ncbi:hypothetical protein IJ384_06470, partial [bacterium]|nr:hypothetical protein [bacterium]
AQGGESADTFMISNGSGNEILDTDAVRNTVINNGTGTVFGTNVVDITPRPFELNVKVGIGNGEGAVINTSISFSLFDFDVDLSSAESAVESLEAIDDLILKVSDELLKIGSSTNRLMMALDEQSIKIENMISSRSTLRDADIAKESAKMVQAQILQQAAATLMSSSRNVRQENVLGLLQGLRR